MLVCAIACKKLLILSKVIRKMENEPPACMLIYLSGGWETGNLFGVVLWLHTNACPNVKQRHFVITVLWMLQIINVHYSYYVRSLF